MVTNDNTLLLAISILIGLLLICHVSNFIYSRNKNTKNTKNIQNTQNKFINLSIPTNPIPTQYNDIYYYGNPNQVPCKMQGEAQIPCIVRQKCNKSNEESQLSDSEIALLYKFAYEEAGKEILRRELEIELPGTTIPITTISNDFTNY